MLEPEFPVTELEDLILWFFAITGKNPFDQEGDA